MTSQKKLKQQLHPKKDTPNELWKDYFKLIETLFVLFVWSCENYIIKPAESAMPMEGVWRKETKGKAN